MAYDLTSAEVTAESVVGDLKGIVSFERLLWTILERLPHANPQNRKSWEDLNWTSDREGQSRAWRQVMRVRCRCLILPTPQS